MKASSDLKSLGPKGLYRFEFGSGHDIQLMEKCALLPKKTIDERLAKQLADYVIGLDKVAAVTKGTIDVCEH